MSAIEAGRAATNEGSSLMSNYARIINELIAASVAWITTRPVSGVRDTLLETTYERLMLPASYASVTAGTYDVVLVRMRTSKIALRMADLALRRGAAGRVDAKMWLMRAYATDTSGVAMHNLAYLAETSEDEGDVHKLVALYLDARLPMSLYRAGLLLCGATLLAGPDTSRFSNIGMACLGAAAKAKHPEACVMLGIVHTRQKISDEMVELGTELLETASRIGNVSADHILVGVYSSRAGDILSEPIDIAQEGATSLILDRQKRSSDMVRKAFSTIKHGVGLGDFVSQEMLGRAYARGFGCKKDPKLALLWLGRAGQNGSKPAMHDAARMIRDGVGTTKTKKDPRRAMQIFEQLDDYPPAMCDLAVMIEHADAKRAMQLLNRAVDRGYIPAMAHIVVEEMLQPQDPRHKEIVASLAAAAAPTSQHPESFLAQQTLITVGLLDACAACRAAPPTVSASVLRSCERCNAVKYCSLTCQSEHWSEHKVTCVKK